MGACVSANKSRRSDTARGSSHVRHCRVVSYARRLWPGTPTAEWEGSGHATNDNARLGHTRCLSDLHMSAGARAGGRVGGCRECVSVRCEV